MSVVDGQYSPLQDQYLTVSTCFAFHCKVAPSLSPPFTNCNASCSATCKRSLDARRPPTIFYTVPLA